MKKFYKFKNHTLTQNDSHDYNAILFIMTNIDFSLKFMNNMYIT